MDKITVLVFQNGQQIAARRGADGIIIAQNPQPLRRTFLEAAENIPASTAVGGRAEIGDAGKVRHDFPRVVGTGVVINAEPDFRGQLRQQPFELRRQLRAAIVDIGEKAGGEAPFAWLAMEAAPDRMSCELRLTIWPGGEPRTLGRVDWHGNWAEWA